jgi:WD40 repeat protein
LPCPAAFIPIGFWPDNDHLLGYQTAEGQSDARLQVVAPETGETQTLLVYPLGSMIRMVWAFLTPDHSFVGIPMPDNSIQLFDLEEGRVLATLAGHTDTITAMAFSPADGRFYSGSMDRSVRIWNLSGQLLHSFKPDGADNYPSEIAGLGVSPDGAQLITIPIEGWIKVWATGDLHKLGEYQGPIFGAYNGSTVTFSPDGRFLAVGLAAGTGDVSLWRVADGGLLWRGGVWSFAFSPDGQLFARTEIGTGDTFSEQVMLSSADGQSDIRPLTDPYEVGITTMFFSPDSKRLALTLSNAESQVWDIDDAQLISTYVGSCR